MNDEQIEKLKDNYLPSDLYRLAIHDVMLNNNKSLELICTIDTLVDLSRDNAKLNHALNHCGNFNYFLLHDDSVIPLSDNDLIEYVCIHTYFDYDYALDYLESIYG